MLVNVEGELWIKAPNVTKGYWEMPEATAKSITDGWLHTGDVASIDEEGFVYIKDRLKDILTVAVKRYSVLSGGRALIPISKYWKS